MKITELYKVEKSKCGTFHKNGVKLEPHEEKTATLLMHYGFSIEVIRPTSTPKTHNADILMMGTIWEMKAPTTSNLKTIKKRIHEASEQSGHLIIDLRGVKRDSNKVEKDVIKRFESNSDLRRMILITKDRKVLDFRK